MADYAVVLPLHPYVSVQLNWWCCVRTSIGQHLVVHIRSAAAVLVNEDLLAVFW